jgi:predicted MPP superfamily phosphohydrolase
MRGIPSSILLFFFAFVFLVELISYFGIRLLTNLLTDKVKKYIIIFYIFFSIAATALLFYSFSNPELVRQSKNYSLFYLVISISLINLVPKALFGFATAYSYLIRLLANRHWQLVSLSGSLLLSFGVVLVFLYGIMAGHNNIRIENQNVYFKDLPVQLNGFKIVQISDIHLGSYGNNKTSIIKAVKMIKQTHPDLLLFTGDIVNNFSDEFAGFEPYLKQLSAKYGKFAIQGNHDYGDYYNWPDSTSKRVNLEQIEKGVTDAGFNLMLNKGVQISVKDTSFSLIGVENWGHKPFPQYADLNLAMKGILAKSFKILMTHDPAHWTSAVVSQTDIQLTLSGHTHGGQFGIRIAGIEFSPMYVIAKLWGGLYKSDNQLLYVNRGLGTVGFTGRIEMRPEITVLTLFRAN